MTDDRFALRGDLIWSEDQTTLTVRPDHYLVAEDGCVVGVSDQPPGAGIPVIDHRGKIIIPGLVDLHLHGPQYTFRGMGMDLELLDWLNQNAFPEEARYADSEYARTAYEIFVGDLKRSPTTRACIFATLHTDATLELARMLEERGLHTMVGKVNMDRESPAQLCEADPEAAERETRRFLEEMRSYQRVKPILTPRFVPSCTDALMERLGRLQREYQLPVQSHLSENRGEIELVARLCPDTSFYGQAYDKWGLFGGNHAAVMAHCVYSDEAEQELMLCNGVYVAHCPQSNTNLASGIAPIRRYLRRGLRVGLGTDVAGGAALSMFRAVTDAIQVSKLYWRLVDEGCPPLTMPEAFWLATRGGGAFFGQVGAFEPGYALDALVLDDSTLPVARELTPVQRLERMLYLADERHIVDKYVAGLRICK